MCKLFISYRRDDTQDILVRLYVRLANAPVSMRGGE